MKKTMLLALAVFFLSLTFISCDKDGDNLPSDPDHILTSAELTAALSDIYDDSEAPGFTVAIVKNDSLLYQESFGKATIENGKDYTNQTIQPIGSISKTFIAAAIVKAIEQGYFTLETNINDILPFEVKNPIRPNVDIKVKHLVTHTSGLIDADETYFQAYHILPGEDLSTEGSQLLVNVLGAQQRETIALQDFLTAYYQEGGDLYSIDNFASTDSGATWNYSNIAASLAAFLIEASTGTPYREFVSANILQPLGMNRTAYDVVDLDPNDLAKLYWDKSTPFPKYFNDSYPDGSLLTCNEDLTKYLMDMMKGVRGQSSTLFSSESYAMLFDPLLPEGQVPAEVGENQGIFWFLKEDYIQHDGSDPGTTCNLQFDRMGETGYLLLTNMDASIDEHILAYFQLADEIDKVISVFLNNK